MIKINCCPFPHPLPDPTRLRLSPLMIHDVYAAIFDAQPLLVWCSRSWIPTFKQEGLDGCLWFPQVVTLAFTWVADTAVAWPGLSDLWPSEEAPPARACSRCRLVSCCGSDKWPLVFRKNHTSASTLQVNALSGHAVLSDLATQDQISDLKAHAAFFGRGFLLSELPW